MLRQQRKDPFHLFSFISRSEFEGEQGAGSPAPDTTPVVQTPEQIEKGIADALAGEITDVGENALPIDSDEPVKTDPIVTKTEPKTEPVVTTEFTPNPIWDAIKTSYEKQVGENTFKMPEGITKENEHEVLLDFFRENVERDTSKLHPFVKEVLQASEDENFDPEQFLQSKIAQKSYLDLPSEEFMKLHLKSLSERDKKGWTDEDIDNHIKGKDKIQLDAEVGTLKEQYREYEKQQSEVRKTELKTKRDTELNTLLEKRNNDINSLIEKNKTVNDFYGITFGEAELKDFHKWLPDMLSINKETLSYPLADYLQSDDNLLKVAAIVYKTEKGMRDYLSDLKEGTKSDLMAKLRLTPKNDTGSIVTSGGLQPIDGNE